MDTIEVKVIPNVRAEGTTYHLMLGDRTIVHAGNLNLVTRAIIGIVDWLKDSGYAVEREDVYPTHGRHFVLSRDTWGIGSAQGHEQSTRQ